MDTGKIIGLSILGAFILLIIFMIFRSLLIRRPKPEQTDYSPRFIEQEKVVAHMIEAIQFETITLPNNEIENNIFLEYHSFLERTYPLIMQKAEKTIINRYSVIYKYLGSDENLLPVALLAHQDVVPAPDEGWEFPPFSGHLTEDGYIYGRGSQDMKSQMISALEGLEILLAEGKIPKRTIYFCFGHDEELGGRYGAKKIVEFFKEKKIRFEYVLDEGGAIIDGKIMGIDNKIALVGTCEKGYADITLEAIKEGGHASTPTRRTAVGLLSEAVFKLEKNQMRPYFSQPVKEMLRDIAPFMNPFFKFAIANRDILSPLLKKVLTLASPFTNCIVRTTIAPTQLFGATTPNTLPSKAKANVNCRLNTGETIEKLISHIQKVVGKNISVKADDKSKNPSPVSNTDCDAFRAIRKTVYEAFDGFIMAPYPFIATSDSAYYHQVSDNVYRFTPLLKEESDANRIHGKNERITVDMLVTATRFFVRLYENTCL
ncbi:MAG: Succinyl-diaminopimelate desuccinylase [Firmicutes bacterium ADurb.Bin080]|jgi:carboxypeptidase PM20D1|nr:M20/M25/M40 family metallo-hydrolase [Clostridiales bacterium]OQC14981.1 MAG: Succinyl-diaminopimelate desuccinylase [Firmicutes bacterium ADurb.Bin080]